MRRFNQLLLLSLFVALLSGLVGNAQTAVAPPSNADVEELKQTVRDLALRVSALEAELQKQRSVGTTEMASLRPAMLTSAPATDIRRSVETVSSSGAAPVTATVTATPQAPAAQSSPVAAILPTQLPGGATLNYMFDGYYDYDFDHPIGRVQYLRAYDVLSNAFSVNQADVV